VGLGPLAHVRLIRAFHPSTSFLALSRDRGRHTGRGPGRRDRGIPSHRRRERLHALVERGGATPGHGVPFRAQQRFAPVAGSSPGSASRRTSARTPESQFCVPVPSLEGRYATDTDTHPQLWTSLWTDRVFQGRRPT
jgi:hypothetical protein